MGWGVGGEVEKRSHRLMMALVALTFSLSCHQSPRSPTPSLLTQISHTKAMPTNTDVFVRENAQSL